MARQMIVTADDYGLCEEVDHAIEACLAAGTVTATCVMANMADPVRVARLCAEYPSASTGLHWNLTTGRPLAPLCDVSSLVCEDGRFLSRRAFHTRWSAGRIPKAQIRTELRAQFVALADCITPSFWNTHENLHVWPGLFGLFVETAAELGIRWMRCHHRCVFPHEGSAAHYYRSHPVFWLKGKIIDCWSAAARGRGLAMPDGLIYLPGFPNGKAEIARAVPRLDWSQAKTVMELIIHPATAIRRELFGVLGASRIAEYQTFAEPRLQDMFARASINLVRFEEIDNVATSRAVAQQAF